MQTVNIFKSRKRITGDDAATTQQIKYLRQLCYSRDLEFPFDSMQESKAHLKKYEARRGIKELLSGNVIVFIYPINMEQ